MAVSPQGKHSLYRLAPPLERTSLCQGKLESPDGSRATTTSSQGRDKDSARKAHLRGAGQSVSPVHRKSELKQDKADPSSSPRRLTPTMLQPPHSPSSSFPSVEHTHSLSLSDSDSDTPATSSTTTQHYTEPRPHSYTVAPPPKLGGAWKRGYWLRSSSSHDGPVLVVSAEDASHTDSSRVQVTATQAPSPVWVVRHSPEEYATQDWRRFSSSFVTPPDARKGRQPRSTTLESSWQDDKEVQRPWHSQNDSLDTPTEWHEGHTPSSTLQTGHISSSTFQTGHTPSSTLQTGHIPSSTLQTGHTPSSTLQTGHTPSSALQTGHTPSSTLQTGHTPSSTLQMGHTPSSAYQPVPEQASLSSICASDSLDITELSTLAEAAHASVMGEGGGGIEKSASEELVRSSRERENSVHSKSVELSTIQEHPDTSSILEPSQITGAKRTTKKGRIIPSRYKAAASSFKKPSQPPSRLLNTSTAKKTTKGVKPPKSKMEDSFKIPAPSARPHSSHQPTHPLSFTSSTQFSHTPLKFTPSAMTTSTPAVGAEVPTTRQVFTHDGSFMAMSRADQSTLSGSKLNKSQLSSTIRAGRPGESSVDLEVEVFGYRVFQATYLDVMSGKALREQEEEAKSQQYMLWQMVEQNKQENGAMRKMIETDGRMAALDRTLEVQLQGLSPVYNKLPELEQQYSAMAKALDATRHEMAVRGVLPVDEDQLKTELVKSEQLHGEIAAAIREKVPKVSSFAGSTEAVFKTLEKEFQELERCWKELSKATMSQIYNTSLFFEERQRRCLGQTGTTPTKA